jgi:hypothetical protein
MCLSSTYYVAWNYQCGWWNLSRLCAGGCGLLSFTVSVSSKAELKPCAATSDWTEAGTNFPGPCQLPCRQRLSCCFADCSALYWLSHGTEPRVNYITSIITCRSDRQQYVLYFCVCAPVRQRQGKQILHWLTIFNLPAPPPHRLHPSN